jgi:hypothetical protein
VTKGTREESLEAVETQTNRSEAFSLALRHIQLAAFFLRQAIAADPEHPRNGTLARVARALDVRYRRIKDI